MALVTVQRSPSVGNSPQSSDSGAGGSTDEDDSAKNNRSLSECYFAGKGAAVVLPPNERLVTWPGARQNGTGGPDIQQHLQSMFYLLRPEETLKMAVKLESVHVQRTRYLVVVSCMGRQGEESCLLGIDCNEKTTVGLVLKVLADTTIRLDGDGGFSVTVCGRCHIFKPVSVQAMWSALQTLHKVSSKAREHNYFLGGVTHEWVSYYEQRIESDRSCLNEWHAMDSLESRRPPSPDCLHSKPCEREATRTLVKSSLKEIMMSVDLDEVTSKQVRTRLEDMLDMDLGEYKSFIDEEMLVILGQMDAATEIFPHVYLGSEWNASNLEELNKNGVCHILNVTREIDNFFPGMFDYMNVRVYDDEKTNLLKHWDDTYKYINKAQTQGSKVLVHCKMGVSRSASVVIAYAMKAYNWDLKKALDYVQQKRNCIKPNTNFIGQLVTYQGILDAMKNKEKLQRSKSETNLKTRDCVTIPSVTARSISEGEGGERRGTKERLNVTGSDLAKIGCRPKSWSPDHATANLLFSATTAPLSLSMERLAAERQCEEGVSLPPAPPPLPPPPPVVEARNYSLHVRMPCSNGLAYSVSQNKILQLTPSSSGPESATVTTVKHRVNALESQNGNSTPQMGRRPGLDRRGLVLNLTTQFEEDKTTSSPPPPLSQTKKETWDPGETVRKRPDGDPFSNRLDRVFEREERKERRSVPSVVTEDAEVTRECEVSRQSSWSSYDSAVVLGDPRDCVSRQSSWGSGDTRCCTLPSRNSSWGSYDMRPTENWGTVKRTKQKLEEGIIDVKRVCPDITVPLDSSAKETNVVEIKNSENSVHVTRRCVSVDETKSETFTESGQKSVPGLVQNLKKEFEAKSVSGSAKCVNAEEGSAEPKTEESGKVRSLPSSPVSDRTEKPSPATSLEDLSVRKLVGKYEDRPTFPQPPVPPRKSSLDPPPLVIKHSTLFVHNLKKARQPIKTSIPSPNVVVATVNAKAASKKQQQGKTHPLARLALNKQRHNNPVYNTM
ncbi:protein phosphatase Slingshot isoform X2 [Macrosteles quadrilineatus]|uniref:protein phosphatase Slingshot isoform X2 n=1 Tax=Macrosteles quadrilineatus TaxID=74068 RepID=UPI0023E10208|nr:protein phosphatase Slingshot isoform X2 [Macrosteles quadrilineatus]